MEPLKSGESVDRFGLWPWVLGGLALSGILYIIGVVLFKPATRVAQGPAGQAINMGPANISEAAPGLMHVIPTLTPADRARPAPLVAFRDAEDKPVTLEAFKGKVVVVNLWATWCAPCKAEMPALAALQARYADKDLVVLPLSIDSASAKDKARAFIKANAPLKLYRDPDYALPPAFTPPVMGVPASFLIDRQGRVRGQVNGDAPWTGDAAKAAIDRLLSE